MKKFFIAFFALGLISSLSCLPSEVQRTRLENQRFFDIVGGITRIVDALIRTVQNKLKDLVNQTAGIILGGIANIEDAIKQAISDFSEQVTNVQNKIDALVNEEIKTCLANLNEQIVEVQNNTIHSIWDCYQDGQGELDKISEFISNYTDKNDEEIQTVKDKIQECIGEPNFGDKVKCAVDATTTIRNSIEQYGKNIDETSRGIFETITNSINGTFVCIGEKSNVGQENLDDIVKNVIVCLGDEETTQPENPGTENPTETTQPENPGTENPEETTQPENPATENPEETTQPENPGTENPEATTI